MEKNSYIVKKIKFDPEDFVRDEFWNRAKSLIISNYLWMDNGYTPEVKVKVLYSERNIYVFFKVYEKKVTIKHLNFGESVHKDSCVECFINPFPEKSLDYFNIEINAMGTMLMAVGPDRDNRKPLKESDITGFEVYSSINTPVSGYHGADFWTLHYRIPLQFFEDYYQEAFSSKETIGNFYKCGDETEVEHYGTWNKVESPSPDFHLPQYFGKIHFSK